MAKEQQKGFMCVFTLDRIDELKRFLHFFKKTNDLPIASFLAKDQADAHRIKTLCAFYAPFPFTCMLDIDILVNGNLEEIFDLCLDGKLGVVREKGVPVLNTGVLVFPKEAMRRISPIWNDQYEAKLKKGFTGEKGTWDQDLFNALIKGFPHKEISSIWNHIVKDCSPEDEILIYDQIKLFHFLHHPGFDRNKYKSYQTFTAV